MVRAGRQYLGRKVRILAEYFSDVPEVNVPNDFSYDTEIIRVVDGETPADRRWVFADHDG